MIKIDREKCTSCGFCMEVCQNYVFMKEKDSNAITAKYPDQCCDCGHCVAICNPDAIAHDGVSKNDIQELPPVDITPEAMENLIFSRKSIRMYKDKQVPDEAIDRLIQVATYAGTSSHGQTEDFLVIQDWDFLRKLEELCIDIVWNAGLKYLGSDGLMARLLVKKYGVQMLRQYRNYNGVIRHRKEKEGKGGWVFRNAPTVIAMHGLATNFLGHANCAIATRNMELFAPTLGLGTCWAGVFVSAANKKKKAIHRMLDLPMDREIYGAIMVGYPKHQYNCKIKRKERNVRRL